MGVKYGDGYYVITTNENETIIAEHSDGWWDCMGWDGGISPKTVLAGPFTPQDVINWQFDSDTLADWERSESDCVCHSGEDCCDDECSCSQSVFGSGQAVSKSQRMAAGGT